MKAPSDSNSGFVLISVILAMSLLCLLGGLLQLQLTLVGTLVAEAETQMHSQVLAENGLELARAVVASPETDLEKLLLGGNGVSDCAGLPDWRNPIPMETARRIDLSFATSECDDGLPWMLGISPGKPALGSADEGWLLLRFSNDRDEPEGEDCNDTVVVRAMGVVPSKLRRTTRFAGLNNVSLLEAHLRRERAFDVDTALTLVGQEAALELKIPEALSAGGKPPVAIVEFPQPGLSADMEQAAAGLGLSASQWYRNITDARSADPAFRRLLEPDFWQELEGWWSRMGGGSTSSQAGGGLHLVDDGGELDGRLSGLFLMRGDVIVRSGAALRGMLIHLGGGGIRIEPGASLSGGLWMSGINIKDEAWKPERMHLEVGLGAHVMYDAEIVRRVMAYLPPTVFMCRIIFPEMDG
jgi:hypothetical protein